MSSRQGTSRSWPPIMRATAPLGGALFLLGTILHPARDGHGVAAAGRLYAITHDVQAIGLLLQAVALAGMIASAQRSARRHVLAAYLALVGTLAWLSLIVFDGAHNPVTARYAPDLVHPRPTSTSAG